MAHRTNKKRLAELLLRLRALLDEVADVEDEIREECGVKAPPGDLG